MSPTAATVVHSPPKSSSRTSAPSRPLHARPWSDKDLPSLPPYAVPAIIDFDANFNTALTFATNSTDRHTNENLSATRNRPFSVVFPPRSGGMGKRRSMLSRPHSWMPSSRPSPETVDLNRLQLDDMGDSPAPPASSSSASLQPNRQERSRHVSDSFASFARRSWLSSSRSPSPGPNQEESTAATEVIQPGRGRAPSNSSVMRLKKASRNPSASSSESRQSSESSGKISDYFNKMKPRTQTLVKGKLQHKQSSPASSTASLAPPSTDTRKSHASETSNSTFPEDGKAPFARDPLWSNFKCLETDFQRFQNKTTSLKMNLVRSALMPFLRKHATHSSNSGLHHEDLEFRAIILNKWWTGLLDMLQVHTQPPVPGLDRPTLLDAITTIMMRPEWRQSTPTFRPLAERSTHEHANRKSQAFSTESSSIHSTDSAYLAESARHNVRNMFTTNLVTQMMIIVDKLSARHAPYSLVSFAGKACAYAFFFAPGIANLLVRLWSLTPAFLRRMADELGLPRKSNGESDDIVALFPPTLDQLGWTSVKQMSDRLRNMTQPPLVAARVSWNGPWITRWNGRDTDLFFIFCKYYFILAESFIPQGLPLIEKARAPAFVLVTAQMLSILDSSIHRQAAPAVLGAPVFPESPFGAEASALGLQIPPSNPNVMRGMSENRLVVLLKGVISGLSTLDENVRNTFGAAYMAVMTAVAKGTSRFDHNACFTICDFLEETLAIYHDSTKAQQIVTISIDWPFWFEVCKMILESNNSMSEVRVLSFIYSLWDSITSNPQRKEYVCLEWLLAEETFDRFFNNWCPMVRAYFMRLLCWRICRDAGNANEPDAKIFMTVFDRLNTSWGHYLWLEQDTEQAGKMPPSTAPSFPSPGKRFMIIRTEIPRIQPGLIAGFDSYPTSLNQDLGGPATDFDFMTSSPPQTGQPKKRWSLLGKVFPFTSNTSGDDALETVRRDTASMRTGPATPTKATGSNRPESSDADSVGSSPIYEAAQYVFKFTLSWNTIGTMPPANRILTPPYLPSPANSRVAAKNRTGTPLLAVGRPAPTRAVSGSQLLGLVDSAKNASSDEPVSPAGPSTPKDSQENTRSSLADLDRDEVLLDNLAELFTPIKPTGPAAINVKYSGRALAEWSLIVAECNNFIDRRRDEGVLGIGEVEVPSLGVEGFRKT
ncbi:DUF1765-domain-containing protein [Xylariaceae sp. FL0255]|nr:DUF1765-domain-containing protein [Xylariaceae sp. FL0255]